MDFNEVRTPTKRTNPYKPCSLSVVAVRTSQGVNLEVRQRSRSQFDGVVDGWRSARPGCICQAQPCDGLRAGSFFRNAGVVNSDPFFFFLNPLQTTRITSAVVLSRPFLASDSSTSRSAGLASDWVDSGARSNSPRWLSGNPSTKPSVQSRKISPVS